MKLYLKNIGKLAETSVEINGITVIAGENNTGKSTVGRALFAVFNSFYHIQEQIESERIESVKNWLDRGIYLDSGRSSDVVLKMMNKNIVVRSIVSRIDSYRANGKEKAIRQEILGLLQKFQKEEGIEFDKNSIEDIVSHIEAIWSISDEEFMKTILTKNLNEEFYGQVCNIFTECAGEIQLSIKQQCVSVFLEENEVAGIQNPDSFSLHTEVIYLDDPFVLDKQRMLWELLENKYSGHQGHLQEKIFLEKKEGNLVDEIIVKNKLKRIYDKISYICNGELTYSNYEGAGYREKNSNRVLNMKNLSTGLKTFVILQTLLKNGSIEQNSTIILDEPEIHLHPEWQLLFAELIVLLQKEFGVHVLLNTHSPYFLRAIQVYSAKYGIADRCRYYLSEAVGDQAEITDVTKEIDKIYARLSHPLQRLEDERWQDA